MLSCGEALHREFRSRGVRVTTLCPGPVPTEFQARAGIKSGRGGPRILTLSAEEVAEEGYRGLMEGRRVVIPGFGNKAVAVLAGLLPRKWVLSAMDRRQRRRRSGSAPGS